MFNYINFKSCIENFRKNDQKLNSEISKISTNESIYILPDFEIREEIKIDEFIVYPTERVSISGVASAAYVSRIKFPEWTQYHSNPEYSRACFSSVLSTLLALASEGHVKSFWDRCNLSSSAQTVAIHHPLQIAGPGAIGPPQGSKEEIVERFKGLYNISIQLNSENYLDFMRFCRLYQLAMSNKYVDHHLSLSLMVSAIESVATKAVKVEDVVSDWKDVKEKCIDAAKKSDLDGEFIYLLPTKLEQHYSTKRFVKFMLDNAPLKSLNIESQSPCDYLKRIGLTEKEIEIEEELERVSDPLNYYIHKNRDDPTFQKLGFEKLLKYTYTYRSKFYHEGMSGPNNSIMSSERYLKEISIPVPSPSVKQDDFIDLGQNPSKLWNKLHEDGFVKKGIFEIDKIHSLNNEYFEGCGREIRQVFYSKANKKIHVATFHLMAHIGRIAITKYYNQQLGK